MKTILCFVLLPILIFAQPNAGQFDESVAVQLSIDFALESIFDEEITSAELVDDTVELFITVEFFFEKTENGGLSSNPKGEMVYTLPRSLNSFALVGWPASESHSQRTEEHVNSLLAQNDASLPKEDTLIDWLHPVKYQQNRLGGIENNIEGFGPRIRL